MIVILGDRTMQSLLLPLYDVLEWYFRVPWCISNESIFVGKGPDLFIMNISSWEAYIGQLLFPNSTWLQIGIDSGYSSLVWSVQLCNGTPDFPLQPEIIFEVIDDSIVLLNLNSVVILV